VIRVHLLKKFDGRPWRMGQWLFTGSQGPARLALKRSKTFKENGQRSFTS
jgi:hypothetical protein